MMQSRYSKDGSTFLATHSHPHPRMQSITLIDRLYLQSKLENVTRVFQRSSYALECILL